MTFDLKKVMTFVCANRTKTFRSQKNKKLLLFVAKLYQIIFTELHWPTLANIHTNRLYNIYTMFETLGDVV